MKKSLTIALFLSALWSLPAHAASVTHNFAVRLGVFDASRTQFTYELRGKTYRVQSEVSTNGIFDTLYPFKAEYFTNGKIEGDKLRTESYKYK